MWADTANIGLPNGSFFKYALLPTLNLFPLHTDIVEEGTAFGVEHLKNGAEFGQFTVLFGNWLKCLKTTSDSTDFQLRQFTHTMH